MECFNLDDNLKRNPVIKLNSLKALLLLLLLVQCTLNSSGEATKSREGVQILQAQELYGDLFDHVQTRTDLFPDSKTFVDVIPKKPVGEIREAFADLENKESTGVMIDFLNIITIKVE